VRARGACEITRLFGLAAYARNTRPVLQSASKIARLAADSAFPTTLGPRSEQPLAAVEAVEAEAVELAAVEAEAVELAAVEAVEAEAEAEVEVVVVVVVVVVVEDWRRQW
jgi:hypothetical protein